MIHLIDISLIFLVLFFFTYFTFNKICYSHGRLQGRARDSPSPTHPLFFLGVFKANSMFWPPHSTLENFAPLEISLRTPMATAQNSEVQILRKLILNKGDVFGLKNIYVTNKNKDQ